MKKFLWFVPVMVLMILLGLIYLERPVDKAQGAQGSVFNAVHQALTSNTTVPSTATSTFNLTYYNTATTTYVFNTEGVDQVNFNLFLTASSTNASLYWFYQFANATTTYSDTWFGEDSNSTSGAVVTHTVPKYHVFTPLVTSTSTINITVSNINSKYMKIGFWAGTTTVNFVGLWGEAVLSKPF